MSIPAAIRNTLPTFSRWCRDSGGRIRSVKTSRGRYFQGDALAPSRKEYGHEDFSHITDGRVPRTPFPGTTEVLRVTVYDGPGGDGWFIEARVRQSGKVYEYIHNGDGARDFGVGWREVEDA